MHRMSVGVDFGFDGGIVAIHENKVVYKEKTPLTKSVVRACETDAERDRVAVSKRAADKKKPRYKKTGELKGKVYRIYDTDRITEILNDIDSLSAEYGYTGIFVAIEEPQMFIGRSSPKSYFASGRGQNAWLTACERAVVPHIFVSPKSWKSTMKLDTDKQNSLDKAAELFELPDDMTKDHDLCEAALMAHYIREHAPRYLSGA